MTILPASLGTLPASFRMGVSLVLAYRLEAAVRLASASVVALLNWSLWTAIFTGRDTIAGRTASEMTTYVVVAWAATTFYGNRVDQLVAERFRSGDIAIDLLRPWDLQLHLYARDLGRAVTALLLTTVPLALWTFFFLPLRLPTRPSTWALLLISLLFAHAISFGFSWLVGLAAFRLKNVIGLSNIKALVISVFSGALIPLDIYPDAVRSVVMLLPFQGMSHTPANLFVESGNLAGPLAVQAAWALGLFVIGRMAFTAASRHVVVQGG